MATNYEIAAARNPKWANPEKNMIDLEVDFAPLDEDWVDYTCSPTDVVDHSRTLYTNALAGNYGTVADYSHHTLWTPYYEDSIEVSTEGLVQLLLEKGLLSDDEVDSILLEKTEHVGYYRTTTDGQDKQWGGGIA
jgi:hypothetical protein